MLVLGGTVLVVLVALVVLFRPALSSLLWQALAPVMRVRESLGADEVDRLRAQLAQAQAELIDRDALAEENADLRARLGRADAAAPRVLAGVLQHAPWSAYDTLVVDAGQAQGIAVGDLVYASGQALVGVVREVYASSARVELFSTPGASYQATLNGTLPVAVEGQGGGSMSAAVPAGTDVAVGDTVAFPGLYGGVVAAVSAVDAKEGESFIVIYMHLPVNPADLARVEIQKP